VKMMLTVFAVMLLCPWAICAQNQAQTPPAPAAPAQPASASPAPAPSAAPAPATPDAKSPSSSFANQPVDTLPRKYIDVWNTGDFTLLRTFFSPFFMTSHGHRVPVESGMLERVISFWRRSMPDLNFKIADTVIQGDKVAMRLTFTGTYKAVLFPFTTTPSASGPPKIIHGTEMLFFQITDGKIVEIWEEYDELAMRAEMGGIWSVPKELTAPAPKKPAAEPGPAAPKP